MIRAISIVAAVLGSQVAAQQAPRFEELSDTLPRHVYSGGWEHFVGGGVAVLDCDGDGLPEIAAAGGESPAILLKNGGDMRFTAAAFPEITGVTGLWPLDMNGDGALDLFVARVGANIALAGDGSCGFTDSTDAWGLPQDDRWTTAFTAWWEDDATRPTMAIGNYVDRSDPEGPFGTCDDNMSLRPLPGIVPSWHAEMLAPGYCALSMLAAVDTRGRMTLRISNDRHYYVTGGSEQMWDIAERRFLTQSDGWDAPMLWGMGIASLDITGDGRDEVMLTSMGDQLLQLATEGGYAAAPYEMGTTAHRPHVGEDGRPSTGWHAEWGDVDNDGRADLFIAKGNVDQMPGMAMEDPNTLLMQRADGVFIERAAEAGIATPERARGAALADLDGDGRRDLVVVNRRAPMELYRNVTPEAGGFLRVVARGPEGNAFAVGARIEMRGEGITGSRQITVGGGHGGATLGPVHFGIGNAEAAEVRLRWPDGRVSDWVRVEAGETALIGP